MTSAPASHLIGRIGTRATRWVFASAASIVAGVAATLALAALIAAAGSGGWISFGIACGFGSIAVVALYTGRRTRPRPDTRDRKVALPLPAHDDYSGLPAPPAAPPTRLAVPFASAAGIASLLLFPVGLTFAGFGGWFGATSIVLIGVAIAAFGPIILAAMWVFRK